MIRIIAIVLLAVAVIGLGLVPVSKKTKDFRIYWGDLGARLVEAGVIDESKFPNYYNSKYLEISAENSKVILNTLWALGLGNKNEILLEEMVNYDGKQAGSPAEALAKAGGFASTGGWTLARGDAMTHYNLHEFISLSPAQQALVDQVSRNIYRPCCSNSAHFPDCNHGMAMLGFLELMASQGATEEEMYEAALRLNSFWFPGNGGRCSVD